MTQSGQRGCHLVRILWALGLVLALGAPVGAQNSGGAPAPAGAIPAGAGGAASGGPASGGAASGQPAIKVQADSSGALVPQNPRAPQLAAGGSAPASPPAARPAPASTTSAATTPDATQAPVSGGFAPQGGAKPKPVASGGTSSGALDYQGWERMATRAETAIANTSITNVGLENLRVELTRWREQLLGAQSANATRIATLKDQIAALGPVPAEGTTEDPEIATRRAELAGQMTRLQAPGIAAGEAYRRADGLIREIDRVLRERQADELLKLWPNPLYPGNWSDAWSAVRDTAVALWNEVSQRALDPRARAKLADNLPLIVPFLFFAGGLLLRGPRWSGRLIALLRGPSTARGQRVWEFLVVLGICFVPTLGFVVLAQALRLTAMLGVVGLHTVDAFGAMGLTLSAAVWLGMRVFAAEEGPDPLLRLPPERRAEGRLLTAAFGVLLALSLLRRAAMSEIEVTDAALSVMSLPMILLGSSVLARMGHLLRRAEPAGGDEGRANYQATLVNLLARGALLVGLASPVLAVIGYISAASSLLFPAAMTLALCAALYVVQRLVGDLYAILMRTETDQDSLVPVLISFGLALAMLPLLTLIWGGRVSDLTELWMRFQEGFHLGQTQISPTDFLLFLVVFGIGMALTRLFQGALRNSILPRTSMDRGGQNAIVSGTGYAGITVAALVGINSTGIDLSGLAIVAGALSVGIGFGLQNIVSNFVSGIILLIERPISEGDWIEVGPVQGIVSSISVRSTRIQTFDRSDVIVPNSDLISGRVTNWTRFSLTGRLIVVVGVPYTEDSRAVAKILREIAEAQPLVLLSPPPLVAFMGFQGEIMQFEIRVILRDVNFQVEVRTEINHQIASRFKAETIPFTSAHRDYLQRIAKDAVVDAQAVADEAANIAAVEAILGAPLPETVRVLTREVPK